MPSSTSGPGQPWSTLHFSLRTAPGAVDEFLVREVAPLLDGLVRTGAATAWSFVRADVDGGPHLRVRLRGAEPGAAAALAGSPKVAEATEVLEVTEVTAAADEAPGEALAACASRIAVEVVSVTGRGSGRLAAAVDLAHATAWALGMDRSESARWLRGQAGRPPGPAADAAAGDTPADQVTRLPGSVVHAQVNAVHAAQREGLAGRAAALREDLGRGVAAGPVARWAAAVREADEQEGGGGGARAREAVWAARLHDLFSRLGTAPDEERAVCLLAAHALLDAGQPASHFPTGHLAPDRQYLERSKFRIGREHEIVPRQAPPEELPAGPEVALPAGPVPDVSLWAAVTGRRTVRGSLTGPLTATGLGTLLWGAHAVSHTTGADPLVPHRPYPSAGALYTAGLRLFALRVEGLAPGTYHCVPDRRALRRVADAPSLDEVEALSAYTSAPPDDPRAVVVDEVPAVLGLYVDLGRLRRRYGLRALRMGLLEAGHLAQSLLLTASALGLATTPLGGFRDDLAHELFGLDGLDQPLQYLLPIGRPPA
ncbi:lantibiotic dehydratase C-terminal domain-containing protein [Streptomyces sp. NPDC051555]|uniref:lantibiotic dehydratase C-terminal domain-containing protein n=1 Tax=Streptomyces sp. NPDC051555 TaxID=3365657 RepID=UPI0037AFA8B1